MSHVFDIRKQLKQHDPQLLREFFKSRHELQNVDWSQPSKKLVEHVTEAIGQLNYRQRCQVQILMQGFNKLANEHGLMILHEEMAHRHSEILPVWGSFKNRLDKVLWAYLHAQEAFEEAAVFARADKLSKSRYFNRWSNPPCQGAPVTPDVVKSLEEQLRSYYSAKEMRGEFCTVHRYTRQNSDEYFIAYLPDWPENFMVFNATGEMESLDIPTAFTNVFVYEPGTGALEMIATGGITTQQQLRSLFYQALCGIEVPNADPDRPEYNLDVVLKSGFSFTHEPTDPVDRIEVRQITLTPMIDVDAFQNMQLRFPVGQRWSECLQTIDNLLASSNLSRLQVAVDQIQIRIHLLSNGQHRVKTLTINISSRTCDLKRQDDEVLHMIGERVLKLAEIIHG